MSARPAQTVFCGQRWYACIWAFWQEKQNSYSNFN